MPLDAVPGPCGFETCERDTHYYKEIFIPYSEGISISINHPRSKGKKAHLRLCWEHYNLDAPAHGGKPGRYEFVVVGNQGKDLGF